MARLTGFTKDINGTLLPLCVCSLFKDNLNGTCSFVAQTTSAAVTAFYEFAGLGDTDPQYFVVAWKDDVPHIFDCTDHVLQPLADSGDVGSTGEADVHMVGASTSTTDFSMSGTGDGLLEGSEGRKTDFSMAGTGDVQLVGLSATAGDLSSTGTGDAQLAGRSNNQTDLSITGTGDEQMVGSSQVRTDASSTGTGDAQLVGSSSSGAGVAPTVRGSSINGVSSNTTCDLVISGGVTNGNLLVIGVFAFSGPDQGALTAGMLTRLSGVTIGTVTLDVQTSRADGSDKNYAAIYTVPITGTGALTMRFAFAGGNDFITVAGCEVQLVDVSGTRINATNSANVSTNVNIASGNVATGGAGIIFGVTAPGNPYGTITLAEDGAFTLVGEVENDVNANGSLIYRSVTTNTTDSADWTAGTSCAWCACAIAIKAATP